VILLSHAFSRIRRARRSFARRPKAASVNPLMALVFRSEVRTAVPSGESFKLFRLASVFGSKRDDDGELASNWTQQGYRTSRRDPMDSDRGLDHPGLEGLDVEEHWEGQLVCRSLRRPPDMAFPSGPCMPASAPVDHQEHTVGA
jgi:YD repeat-containing protein